MSNEPVDFRYDIAFLRAFAVLLVVCYHLQLPFFTKGFMGVDVFFVISGYLMTSMLLKQDRLSWTAIAHFYLARIKRLLPTLLIVLLVCVIPIYFIVGIKLYDYSRYALASLLFISNGYNYLNAGYFDASSELNFLLHTWTLSLEAQFYVLFPWFLWGTRRWIGKKRVHLVFVFILLILLSFSLLIFNKNRDLSYAFYSLESRFWEFLLGGLAFVLTRVNSIKISPKFVKLLSLLGWLILIAVVFFPLGKFLWPSWYTILPVLAVAVILFVQADFAFYKQPIVLFIASRSYAWYLWHWPLVVLCYYLNLGELWWVKIGLFLGSLLFANLTYLYIERKSYFRDVPRLALGFTVCAALFFLGTLPRTYEVIFNKEQGNLFQFFYQYPREIAPNQYGFHQFHVRDKGSFSDFDKVQLRNFSTDSANYLLLGDCHAGMFSTTIRKLARQHGVHLMQATADDAFPTPYSPATFAGPKALMDYMFEEYFPRFHQQIDRVILMVNYADYSKAQLTAYFDHNKQYFGNLGIPITYISQTEQYALEYPVLKWLNKSVGLNPRDRMLNAARNANQFVQSYLEDTAYVDVYDKVHELGLKDTIFYLYDADHFSVQGTNILEEVLSEGIFKKP